MTAPAVLSLGYTSRVEVLLLGACGGLSIGTDPSSIDLLLSPIFRGESGPAGVKGDKGDRGDSGAPGGTTYEHDQMVASTTWTVEHNLGRFPSVTVVDSANTTVDGDVDYVDSNNLVISFSVPFAGKAYLN